MVGRAKTATAFIRLMPTIRIACQFCSLSLFTQTSAMRENAPGITTKDVLKIESTRQKKKGVELKAVEK